VNSSPSDASKQRLGRNAFEDALLTYLGPLSWALKEHWVLPLVTFASVIGAPALLYYVPRTAAGEVEPWVRNGVVTLAIVGALAVLADRLADRYDSRVTEEQAAGLAEEGTELLAAAEQSTLHRFNELNWLLDRAHGTAFLSQQDARDTLIDAIRDSVVKAAASALGPGSRATYYQLVWDDDGTRRLVNPRHALTVGRSDQPEKEWVERSNPTHGMWTLLNRDDSEPPIFQSPDPAANLDWNRVDYDCFVTLPVRAEQLVFGVLSVNSSDLGAIGETEKAMVLAAARLLALVEATHRGAEQARTDSEAQEKHRKKRMSAGMSSVATTNKGEADDHS